MSVSASWWVKTCKDYDFERVACLTTVTESKSGTGTKPAWRRRTVSTTLADRLDLCVRAGNFTEPSASSLLCTCTTFGTTGIRCELSSSQFQSRRMHCVPVASGSTLPFLVSYRNPPHPCAKRHCAASSICNHAMTQEFQTRVMARRCLSWNSVFSFRFKIPK